MLALCTTCRMPTVHRRTQFGSTYRFFCSSCGGEAEHPMQARALPTSHEDLGKRREEALLMAQLQDLGNQVTTMRAAMQELLRVAIAVHDAPRGSDDFISRQNMCEFVRMTVERAL